MPATTGATFSGTKGGVHAYRPEVLRMDDAADRERIAVLRTSLPPEMVHDTIGSQLSALLKALHPGRSFTQAELERMVQEHLAGRPAGEHGVWVFYPWSQRLVHLLPEEEFVRLRTDRNRDKITAGEQAVLATKRVGVIGLSVGQSVAFTLALERSFGELRLADFDELELSNMNRLRAGVHELGGNKAVLCARAIAELDPFLKVVCFTGGITRENIDAFLTEGGKLDAVVEECDDVAVKILARQRAKAHGIAVLMDTNDRGMVDVERFDLEPERPLLHGLIAHLDPEAAFKARSLEEKLPFLAPMAGLEHLSPRMKASMLQVGHTISSWPQLGSSTVLGGALVADAWRRMALGQFTGSGRWYVDVDELVGGASFDLTAKTTERATAGPSATPADTLMQSAARVHLPADMLPLSGEEFAAIAQAGALAPSADNMQPWLFLHHRGTLVLFHDRTRSASVLDPSELIPHLGLGMCIENMLLQASAQGLETGLTLRPLRDDEALVAMLHKKGTRTCPDEEARLAAAIPERHTNRQKGDGRPIGEAQLLALTAAAEALPGIRVHLLRDMGAIAELARVQGAADRIRIMNEHGHREFFGHQLRWTREEAERTRDGLDVATLELGPAERVGLRMASSPAAIRTLGALGGARSLDRMSANTVKASGAIALITAPAISFADRIAGGRAAQRLWLKATSLGLAVHPLSAPVFLGQHVVHGGGVGLSAAERTEIAGLFNAALNLFGAHGREPLFMVRLSHAPPPTARALRRPLSEMTLPATTTT